MKILGKICMILILTASMIVVISCSKDNDGDGSSSISSLESTYWEGISKDNNFFYTIKFSTRTFVLEKISKDNQEKDNLYLEGAYEFDGQTVTMTFTKALKDNTTMDVALANSVYTRTATIEGSTLVYIGVTFNKQ